MNSTSEPIAIGFGLTLIAQLLKIYIPGKFIPLIIVILAISITIGNALSTGNLGFSSIMNSIFDAFAIALSSLGIYSLQKPVNLYNRITAALTPQPDASENEGR